MKLHPSTYCVLHFTPGTRIRGAQDRFKPLLLIALAVLGADILYLLQLEAMYREDARSRNSPSLREDARGEVLGGSPWSASPGARITGQRNGQPTLEL